jgi:hypothetical protein
MSLEINTFSFKFCLASNKVWIQTPLQQPLHAPECLLEAGERSSCTACPAPDAFELINMPQTMEVRTLKKEPWTSFPHQSQGYPQQVPGTILTSQVSYVCGLDRVAFKL